MAEFPSLPLFTDAYLADAGHLSDCEHGRYFLLLMMLWRSPECRIPNDDEWMARRFRRSVELVREQLRPIISEFMQCDGNWISQKRLRKEWEYCRARSGKNSQNAKARWDKEKGLCDRNAPNPNPNPKKIKSTKSNNLPPAPIVFQHGVIRLTQVDFDKWVEAFPTLSLKAELTGLAEWASQQKKWYFAVAGALAKRNRDEIRRRAAASNPTRPVRLMANGQPWPDGIE